MPGQTSTFCPVGAAATLISEMKTSVSVLINNFNYARFLDRAIESVLAQTAPVDEIIVVDDGSTDNSREVLQRWAARDARIQPIFQANGGQLSCFNAGFVRSTGDIVCFLDADDEYYPGHIERLLGVYQARPEIDFVFCRCKPVSADGGDANNITLPWEVKAGDFDYGLTFCRATFQCEWLGSPTSAISVRRKLLGRILPCPLESQWRMHADNVLVFGAAAFWGRKYYLATAGVRYHLHGGNHWFGVVENIAVKLSYEFALTNLLHHYNPGFPSSRYEARGFSQLLYQEFTSIPEPGRAEYQLYQKLIRKFGRRRRLKFRFKLWERWRKILRRRRATPVKPG